MKNNFLEIYYFEVRHHWKSRLTITETFIFSLSSQTKKYILFSNLSQLHNNKLLGWFWPHYTVGIWNLTIWNPEIFEIWAFWRSVFEWSGFSYGYSYSRNHLKTGPFDIRTFLSRFQMGFLQNGGHFSGFQMVGLPDIRSHLKSGSFATPTSLGPFKIQTSLDFRSHLYW